MRLAIELCVGDFLHPVHRLAIERLGDGDMGHGSCCRRAMPMLLTRRNPDDIAGPDILLGATLHLHPARAGRHYQGLTQRMSVPGRSCTWLECHGRTADAGGS